MFTQKKEREMKRREFLKSIAAAAAVCSVPNVLGISEDPPSRPVFIDEDGLTHYPVMERLDGETMWEKKSPYEILADINIGIARVQEMSFGNFEPSKDFFGIMLPRSRIAYLHKKLQPGIDIQWFIKHCWPNASIFSGVFLDGLDHSGYAGSAEFIVLWDGLNSHCERLRCYQYGI